MATLKFAVLGLGRIGKIHLQNLILRIPEVQVLATVDPSAEGKAFSEKWKVPYHFDSHENLFSLEELDAVVICSPTDTHTPYTQAFARKGKHVFCEKPLDLSLEAIKEVGNTLKETGTHFMLAFNRRFDKHFARIRQKVESGIIGDPHILKITSRDPGPPPISYIEGSGGLFLDMTIHDFDMARFIVGKEVEEVYAVGKVRVDKSIGEAGDIDTAVISLVFEDGTLAIIDNSRKASYGYDQRLEIFGSKGMAQISNQAVDSHQTWTAEGSKGALLLDFFMERYEEAYFQEMKAFVEALTLGGKIPVGVYDGLMATAIGVSRTEISPRKTPHPYSGNISIEFLYL